MTDMTSVIQPKSDQLNFDDFCGGKTLTIKITKVSKVSGEQPILINYENDGGKPWKPCKSMCRVLVNCWGGQGQSYVGKSLTLYGDPTVKWAGMEVGGIRISHLSDIPAERVMALTTSKSNRKPFTVKPLVMTIDTDLEALKQECRDVAGQGGAALDAWLKAVPKEKKKHLAAFGAEMRKIADDVDVLEAKRIAEAQTEQVNLPE
jgi:hypothetical protein